MVPLHRYHLGDRSPCRRSQWVDSNHRPPASETGALAKLSYTKMVAVSGLEPLASCIPSRRALHAALHHGGVDGNRTRSLLLDRQACWPVHHYPTITCSRTGRMERQAGFEPATSTLGRWHATHCITDAWSTRQELNPLHPRWRRGILPVNYWCLERQAGLEPATPALATRCSPTELLPQGSAPGTRTPTVTVNSRSHYHCASAEGMGEIGGAGAPAWTPGPLDP